MRVNDAGWRAVCRLWPLGVALLVACGGAADGADDVTDNSATEVADRATAEARRRTAWTYCASENSMCALSGSRLVRYGIDGAYFYKTVSDSVACSSAVFGGDPAAGKAKHCDWSKTATATTPAPAPAPAPVGAATLQWTASSDARTRSYRVYYGMTQRTYEQSAGQGILVGNATAFTVNNLSSGRSYYFSVTAVDDAGAESSLSNEASKLIP